MTAQSERVLKVVKFNQAVDDITGGQFKVKKRDFLSEGILPVIDQGQSLIAGYTNNSEAIFVGDLPIVLFGDHTLTLKYVDFPFALGADGVKALSIRKAFLPKYLYYYWQSHGIQSRGYSRHSKFLKEIPLPLIPLSEQRRIVELLNQADDLRKKRTDTDSKAALILSAIFHKMFGDPATNPKKWPTEELGNLFDIVGGGTPSKAISEYWSGNIPWVSPKDMKHDVIIDTEDHITAEAIEKSATRIIKKGSILIVYRSGILIHSFPVAIAGRDVTINQDLKALSQKSSVINEYLYGWINAATPIVMSCIKKGATVQNVDGPRFLSLQIAKPPRPLQYVFARHLEILLEQKIKRQTVGEQIEQLFKVLLHRAFSGDLTTRWREAHMKELLAEMEQQTKYLSIEASA